MLWHSEMSYELLHFLKQGALAPAKALLLGRHADWAGSSGGEERLRWLAEEAEPLLGRPPSEDQVAALCNKAALLGGAGRFQEAAGLCSRAIGLAPR
ncbi:hypothetical protein WJX81_001527 [Elliptochloris bilobata]|uniref:Uncharacterized protein n=1 Tax=Elliptochloris bilobata TaxID=381761 RepID=A0AAW1RGM3_9CHLO